MLKVRDLSVSFQTEDGLVPAVSGVSLDVAEGEILGIVGESGSGKTMTVMSIMGLISDPNAIIGGSIAFRNRELLGLPPRELRKLRGREIAMIFQDPMTALTPVYTIGHQIAEQITAHERIGKRAALSRAADLIAEVNIPAPREALARYPHELSGGMRQRAVIAMALSCNPSLLIADEPTTAVDVTVQAQILELMLKLSRNHGSAILFITHDMGVIAEIADRVVVMYAGRVVEEGAKREVLGWPRHPYTRALLDSIPPLTGERPRRLRAIGGAPPSPANLPHGCAFSPRCPLSFEKCSIRPELYGSVHRAACFREEHR